MKYTLYTTHCAMCNILLEQLKRRDYKINIISDMDVVTEKADELGIYTVPFLFREDGVFFDFSTAIEHIENLDEYSVEE